MAGAGKKSDRSGEVDVLELILHATIGNNWVIMRSENEGGPALCEYLQQQIKAAFISSIDSGSFESTSMKDIAAVYNRLTGFPPEMPLASAMGM